MIKSKRLSFIGFALVVLGALSLLSLLGTGIVKWFFGLYWVIWVLAGLLELYIIFWLVKSIGRLTLVVLVVAGIISVMGLFLHVLIFTHSLTPYLFIGIIAGLLEVYVIYRIVKSGENRGDKIGVVVVFHLIAFLMLFGPSLLAVIFSFILSTGFAAGQINGFDRYCGNCDYDAMDCSSRYKVCGYDNTINCLCCDCYAKYSFDACNPCFIHGYDMSYCGMDGKCNLDW